MRHLSPPQRLLKNMKYEGIEIALEGIWYPYSLKASAEEWLTQEFVARKRKIFSRPGGEGQRELLHPSAVI